MRSLLVAWLVLAGCHAQSAPARAPGTTGFPGLDWGANATAVAAAYPTATVHGAIATVRGAHEGRAATITFALDGAGGALASIDVAFDDAFASMDGCARTWAELRAALDARLGPSQSDNLAAYWTSPTAAITLACNPTDDDRAALAMRYEPGR